VLKVETQNSTYEVDTVGKRIRRLNGSAEPTDRQGPDMVWKPYARLDKVLGCYLIDWDGEGHCTITSHVVSEKQVSLS
jgi:hypothetical protein